MARNTVTITELIKWANAYDRFADPMASQARDFVDHIIEKISKETEDI